MAIKTFQRGLHGKSTYVCANCKHNTRNVGGDEASCGLCLACYDEAGIENGHADGHHDKQADMTCYQCNPEIKTVIQQRADDAAAKAEAESFNNPVSTIKVKSQTARVVCKNTVPSKKEKTMKSMKITNETSAYGLRKQGFSDYTILRLLVKRTGCTATPAALIKRNGSAYKAARLLLANSKRRPTQ